MKLKKNNYRCFCSDSSLSLKRFPLFSLSSFGSFVPVDERKPTGAQKKTFPPSWVRENFAALKTVHCRDFNPPDTITTHLRESLGDCDGHYLLLASPGAERKIDKQYWKPLKNNSDRCHVLAVALWSCRSQDHQEWTKCHFPLCCCANIRCHQTAFLGIKRRGGWVLAKNKSCRKKRPVLFCTAKNAFCCRPGTVEGASLQERAVSLTPMVDWGEHPEHFLL